MSGSSPLRRRHANVDGGSARRALSPLALTADPKDVFGAPSASGSGIFSPQKPPLDRRQAPPSSPRLLKSPKSKRSMFESPERHTRARSNEGDFREGGLLSPKKRFVPGQDVPLSPLKRRHGAGGHRARSDSVSSVGSVGSMLDEEMLASENEADDVLGELFPRWGAEAVVKKMQERSEKGKERESDDDAAAAAAEELDTTLLQRRAATASATRSINLAGAQAIASDLKQIFPTAVRAVTVPANASASSSRASASRSSASAASRSRARASSSARSSRSAASRRAASRASSRASASSASAAAAASLSSIDASVSSLFASAASSVNSAISAGETPVTVAAASTASSVVPTSAATTSSDSAAAATSAASTSQPISSADSASAAMSTTSASSAPGATLSASAKNRTANLERIVIPSVVVPVGFLVILIAIILCCRRSRKKEQRRGMHSPTPSSFGVMGSPRGNFAAGAGGFGGGPMFGGQKAGYAGSDAGLVVGPNPYADGAAGGMMAERGMNQSVESFATSPSAIGVAVGEGTYANGEGPVTVWGRRSLRDVVASGSAAASSMMSSPHEEPIPARPDRQTQAGSYIAGRQPSIASMRGSIDGPMGYQPGQPRPVYTPDRNNIASPTNYDSFPTAAMAAVGGGGAVAGSALEHGIRPVSEVPSEFTEDAPSDSYYGGIIGAAGATTQSASTPMDMRSPLSEQTEDLDDASVNGEGATSDPRSSGYNQPYTFNALQSQQSQYADAQSQIASTDDDIFSDPPSASSSPEVAPVNFNSSSGESEAEGTVQGTPRQESRAAGEGGTPRAGGGGGEGEKWW